MKFETDNDFTEIETPNGIKPEHIAAGILTLALLLWLVWLFWPRGGSGSPSAGAGHAMQASGLPVDEMAAILKW